MRITLEEAKRLGLVTRRPRRKKPEIPDSYHPHECVVLSIDPGRVSGWAVLVRGVECHYGQSNDTEEWARAVCVALEIGDERGLPVVVVMETWSQGSRKTDARFGAPVLLGLGAAQGEWKRLLALAKVPKRRLVTVYPQTWRARVIGGPMNRTTAEWKAAAKGVAEAAFGRLMRPTIEGHLLGPDAAEAVCQAIWASRAGKVGAVLPKRVATV